MRDSYSVALCSRSGVLVAPAKNQHKRRGSSAIEFALVTPVIFYLLLITFDLGLHVVALIAVENAARTAAARNSNGVESAADQEMACAMALAELKGLPAVATNSDCTGGTVEVTSVRCNSTTPCTGGGSSADGSDAAFVRVKYTLPPLFQLPIVGPESVIRSCQMKVRSAM